MGSLFVLFRGLEDGPWGSGTPEAVLCTHGGKDTGWPGILGEMTWRRAFVVWCAFS